MNEVEDLEKIKAQCEQWTGELEEGLKPLQEKYDPDGKHRLRVDPVDDLRPGNNYCWWLAFEVFRDHLKGGGSTLNVILSYRVQEGDFCLGHPIKPLEILGNDFQQAKTRAFEKLEEELKEKL